MSVEIKELNKLLNKFNKMSKGNLENVDQEVYKLTEAIASDARNLVPADTGQLRQNIFTRVEKDKDGISGEVFSNLHYAAYVEFGTGIVGQAAGLKREGITLAYRQTPWIIPVGAITAEQAEKYHYAEVKDKDGNVTGYFTRGARPHPFLYPALENNRDEISKKLKAAIMMELRNFDD